MRPPGAEANQERPSETTPRNEFQKKEESASPPGQNGNLGIGSLGGPGRR